MGDERVQRYDVVAGVTGGLRNMRRLDGYGNEVEDRGLDEMNARLDAAWAEREQEEDGNAVAEARDAMCAKNRDAWKTGRRHRGDGNTASPAVLANAVRAWERMGRRGPKPTAERPDPTAASQTPSYAKPFMDPTDTNTPEEYDFGKKNAEAGQLRDVGSSDEVKKARDNMIAKGMGAWKTGKKFDPDSVRQRGRRI
jgi:hypothetical protein